VKRKATKSNSRRLDYLSEPHAEFLRKKLAYPLSPRELQVLIALGEGKTTREIRSQLNVSGKTVNAYFERLKKKLELGNMNQLIRAAALLREGIIALEPNGPQNGSLRVCPRCRKLFSDESPKEDMRGLAGYRVLAAVLSTSDRFVKATKGAIKNNRITGPPFDGLINKNHL